MNASFGLLTRDSDIQGGVPVFSGTRVPLRNLTEYLVAGDSIDDFLNDFPSVSRAHAVGVLRLGEQALAGDLAI